MALRNLPAAGSSGNEYVRGLVSSGFGTRRSTAFVTMPRVPSAPKNNGVRSASAPPASASDAVLRRLPSGRTTSRFATASRRLPPRRPPKPVLPELIAPPTVLPIALSGTFGRANPFDSTKSSTTFHETPVSTDALRPQGVHESAIRIIEARHAAFSGERARINPRLG